jgi:hypothetical protein
VREISNIPFSFVTRKKELKEERMGELLSAERSGKAKKRWHPRYNPPEK